jgi:vancomycin resistance protein YoaR
MRSIFGWTNAFFWITVIIILLGGSALALFQRAYEGKVYPNVYIAGISFGGKTPQEVENYWRTKNSLFPGIQFELHYDTHIATISGTDLDLGYDATLSATQAYFIGRSPYWLSNLETILLQKHIDLFPYFRWNTQVIDDMLNTIAGNIDIPVEDALFKFGNGRVTAFRPSKNGLRLNKVEAKRRIEEAFYAVDKTHQQRVVTDLPVEVVHPSVSTDHANTLGIKELIGKGYSEFTGSIPGRIHNVALAASRVNGVLIKPGDTFSFNDTIGDISAATGYQSAYIIKEGRTVLGDGGGVCQVSSTLFRAALAAGLSIVERQAHAYRVHYYEEGGFKPGLDATVFGPTVDFKFKNDTPAYILIQTKIDLARPSLTFEFYGTRDGRIATITNHKVWDITPAPPPLFQDDPTLARGVTKQVDWSAQGTKASFDYKVTRDNEILENKTFFSTFRPWQAVFLKGTL